MSSKDKVDYEIVKDNYLGQKRERWTPLPWVERPSLRYLPTVLPMHCLHFDLKIKTKKYSINLKKKNRVMICVTLIVAPTFLR